MKAIFFRESGAGYLLFALALISLLLASVDALTGLLMPVRQNVGTLMSPVYFIAQTPYQLTEQVGRVFASRDSLQQTNDELEQRLAVLAQVSQQVRSLSAENERLRALLGSQERLATEVLISEIVGVVPDPRVHQVVLDKGADAGVFVGQAVIDATGLFGQVIAVENTTARVLLVSDVGHAVPVEVNRNGVRSIASGTGVFNELSLESVPVSTDIRENDLLVTSALGGRFPRGYPVGSVRSVVIEPGAAFAQVTLQPAAALDRTRYVLLVRELPPQVNLVADPLEGLSDVPDESAAGVASGSSPETDGETQP